MPVRPRMVMRPCPDSFPWCRSPICPQPCLRLRVTGMGTPPARSGTGWLTRPRDGCPCPPHESSLAFPAPPDVPPAYSARSACVKVLTRTCNPPMPQRQPAGSAASNRKPAAPATPPASALHPLRPPAARPATDPPPRPSRVPRQLCHVSPPYPGPDNCPIGVVSFQNSRVRWPARSATFNSPAAKLNKHGPCAQCTRPGMQQNIRLPQWHIGRSPQP